MSGFDVNPFGEPNESNPFADPAVTQVTSQTNRAQSGLDDYNPFADQNKPDARTPANLPQYQRPPPKTDLTHQPAMMQPVAEPPPPYAATGAQTVTTAELQRRQEELERKAAELQAKEDALRNAPFNVRANNWPPLPKRCCVGPCFYQDIAVDIPLEFQKVVRGMYYLWMFYSCVLFLNVLGSLALLVESAAGATFGFSILAFVLFTPLSYLCWFRSLYKAFRSDSSFNFMVFFFIFFFQFILAVIYTVGIPSVGSCGFINGITVISGGSAGHYAAGGIALVIAFLWGMTALMMGFMLIKIHRMYRSTGASFAKAQQEFSAGILQNEHVQNAAVNAATGAARQTMQQNFSGGNRY